MIEDKSGAPLILTAMLDKTVFAKFDQLRRGHYPRERNLVPAHLTLFRHLPGTETDEILRRLKAVARGTPPIAARVAGVRYLGEGVAFGIDAPALEDLRAELADAWAFWLVPQDQRFWPHVTIQNKVEAKAAKALQNALAIAFVPWTLTVEGLTLWRYHNGPWEKLRDVRFR